jgi:translocation protein SEC63
MYVMMYPCAVQLDVKEAPEVPTVHPQWDMLDDEEEEPEGDDSDASEFTTDEDVEDEQD